MFYVHNCKTFCMFRKFASDAIIWAREYSKVQNSIDSSPRPVQFFLNTTTGEQILFLCVETIKTVSVESNDCSYVQV